MLLVLPGMCTATIEEVRHFDDVVDLFSASPEQVVVDADQCIERLHTLQRKVIELADDERTFENTVEPIRHAMSKSGDAAILKVVHSTLELLKKDAHERKVAQEQAIRLRRELIDMEYSTQLYGILKLYQETHQHSLNDQQQKTLKKALSKFSCVNGDNAESAASRKEINRLERVFAENLTKGLPLVACTQEELAGVPAHKLQQCAQDDQGRYLIQSTWPLYSCANPQTRERLFKAYGQHMHTLNGDVVSQIYAQRNSLARKKGFDNYADQQLSLLLYPEDDKVEQFLGAVSTSFNTIITPYLKNWYQHHEDAALCAGGKIAPWDLNHMMYSGGGHTQSGDVSWDKVREVFFNVTGALFGYDVAVLPHGNRLWHEDIVAAQVKKNDEVVAYILFDPFGRAGKPNKAHYFVTIVPRSREAHQPAVYVAVGSAHKKDDVLDRMSLSSMGSQLVSVLARMNEDVAYKKSGFSYGLLSVLSRYAMNDDVFWNEIAKKCDITVSNQELLNIRKQDSKERLHGIPSSLHMASLALNLSRGESLEKAEVLTHERHFPQFLSVPYTCGGLDSVTLSQFGPATSIQHIYHYIAAFSLYAEWKKHGLFDSDFLERFVAEVLEKAHDVTEIDALIKKFLGIEKLNIDAYFEHLAASLSAVNDPEA